MAKKDDDKGNILYKAYRYRIYPNQEQREYFAKCFGCARYVYNQLLDKSIKHYEATGKHKIDSYTSLFEEAPWLKEVDSNALNYAKGNLKDAYDRLFKKQAQRPRFKSRKDSTQSYTTYRARNCANVDVVDGKLKLPKVKNLIKMKMHRPLMKNASIQTATISRNAAGKY